MMTSILVIDDEASIRNLLHAVLKRKGYEVFLADSGQTESTCSSGRAR